MKWISCIKGDINLEPFAKSGCPHRLGVLEDGRIHANELTGGGDNLAIHRRKNNTSGPFNLNEWSTGCWTLARCRARDIPRTLEATCDAPMAAAA